VISYIVYTVIRLLLSHGCIHSAVNENTAIDGKGELNRKRLRSTDVVNQPRLAIFEKCWKTTDGNQTSTVKKTNKET